VDAALASNSVPGPSAQPAPQGDARSPGTVAFAVDESGIRIRNERVAATGNHSEETLRNALEQGTSAPLGEVAVQATRAAPTDSVAALVRALAASGAKRIDVTTPSSDPNSEPSTLSITTLQGVPMHEDRCGVQFVTEQNGAVEMQYLRNARPTRLPEWPSGPEIASAIDALKQRMRGCESTVWMLAGKQKSIWGLTFDVGMSVLEAKSINDRRFLMLLRFDQGMTRPRG
jgi:hypothetical protein